MGVFVAKASEKRCTLCGRKVDVLRMIVTSTDSVCDPVYVAACPRCDRLTKRERR